MNEEKPVRKIKLGIYKHFKGGRYRVIAVAKNTKNLEDMVIYEMFKKSPLSQLWIRPYDDFVGYKIMDDGTKIKRFEYIGPDKNNIK